MTAAAFHTQVRLTGYPLEDVQFTVKLSGTIDVLNDLGKAVTIDTAAANTFKLAADGDRVYGRLLTAENRINEGQVIGTVAFEFTEWMPTTGTVAVGDSVIGGGAGTVKTNATPSVSHPANNVVVEIKTGFAAVMKLGL